MILPDVDITQTELPIIFLELQEDAIEFVQLLGGTVGLNRNIVIRDSRGNLNAVSQVFGAYEYEHILQTFVDKGFIVISEPRPKGTDVQQYAAKVVGQINSLVQAGVPPQKITVVGASKGGAIAVATSSQLKNRDINFALVAACGNSDMYGNVLSVWDYLDDTGAAMCGKYFAQAKGLNRHKEVELRVGLGHGILYRPLKEWVDLVIEWANQP